MSTPKENWVKGYSAHSQRRATSECEHGPYAMCSSKKQNRFQGAPRLDSLNISYLEKQLQRVTVSDEHVSSTKLPM